jgi:hypothetical protein
MTPDPSRLSEATIRVYQGYRYTIITFINGAGKPPSAQAELWGQRESDTPLARWTYFRRPAAATGWKQRASSKLTSSTRWTGARKVLKCRTNLLDMEVTTSYLAL